MATERETFENLLPLTLAIAGLSQAEPGKYFNEDQMEIRANVVRQAFKQAKAVADGMEG